MSGFKQFPKIQIGYRSLSFNLKITLTILPQQKIIVSTF